MTTLCQTYENLYIDNHKHMYKFCMLQFHCDCETFKLYLTRVTLSESTLVDMMHRNRLQNYVIINVQCLE